jgi:hypothetical protein
MPETEFLKELGTGSVEKGGLDGILAQAASSTALLGGGGRFLKSRNEEEGTKIKGCWSDMLWLPQMRFATLASCSRHGVM